MVIEVVRIILCFVFVGWIVVCCVLKFMVLKSMWIWLLVGRDSCDVIWWILFLSGRNMSMLFLVFEIVCLISVV